ncbi:MAG: arylsulfatase [Prolixibacteraceae bacterium]
MENHLIIPACLFTLGAATPVQAQMPAPEKATRPNIIILVADDLGWDDVGYHGSHIKTPNIDKLSEEGVQLTRFYVAPVCSPTRAGLLTGMYPNRFGLRETVIPPWRDFGMEPSVTIIPEFLEEHGYENRAIIGKWHLGHSRPEYYPLKNGFTHFYGHLNGAIDYFTHEREGELDWHNDYASCYDQGYSTDLIAEESVQCIRKYAKEGPFFLYVAFNAPHTPLQAKPEDLKLYGYDESKPAYSGKTGTEAIGQGNTRRQTYAAMVTCMDRGIGRILQALKELKIDENTLVLFMSDNGADEGSGGGSGGPLRGHKFQEFDGGVLSPAIIRWPAGFQGSREVGQLTGFTDIFPTICEIVDPEVPAGGSFDGISMLKVLNRTTERIDRSFYLGCGALIENNRKIIRAGKNPKMDLSHDVLFDLHADPYEKNDLSDKYTELKNRLIRDVAKYDSIRPAREVPPYGEGRKGFVAPKEWNIFRHKTEK